MNDTFYDGHDQAKFGEDRTMRAGCRCENVVFVFVFVFVCHAPSPEHRAFEGCIVRTSYKHCVAVYCPISTRFSAFFQNGLLF